MAHNLRLWAVLRAQPTEGGLCELTTFFIWPDPVRGQAVNSGRKPTRRVGLLVNTWPGCKSWAVLRVKSTRRVDFTSYLLQSTTLRVVQQALHVAGWREIAAFFHCEFTVRCKHLPEPSGSNSQWKSCYFTPMAQDTTCVM